jgi:hypothetical protein
MFTKISLAVGSVFYLCLFYQAAIYYGLMGASYAPEVENFMGIMTIYYSVLGVVWLGLIAMYAVIAILVTTNDSGDTKFLGQMKEVKATIQKTKTKPFYILYRWLFVYPGIVVSGVILGEYYLCTLLIFFRVCGEILYGITNHIIDNYDAGEDDNEEEE